MAKKDKTPPTQSTNRPPIVTVMGHVDHGKTSLLDAIRNTRITEGESGGITQHIGAYQVTKDGQTITFIDTPGHAAFTQMRARGAHLTDIVILVVAADDGVMPQTKEAIAHAQAAEAPIIVALNKIDAEGAQPERVKEQLAREGVLVEGYGGNVPLVPTSAIQNVGIDELLEMVVLLSEILELKADTTSAAQAVVVESNQDAKRGALANIIVQKGVLKVGDVVISGTSTGKVRAMTNDQGQPVRQAGPSTPVEVLGLKTVPAVGAILEVISNEKEALALAKTRQEQQDQQEEARQAAAYDPTDLSALFANTGEVRELKLVLKADTQGSLEAIVASIEQIQSENGDRPRFILAGTGNVSESDVMLAATSGALLLAFRVKVDSTAQRAVDFEKVMVQQYDIIYQLLEDIEDVLSGGIPEKEVPVKGRAEVLQTFELRSGDIVAGCRITDGLMRRNWKVRITRDEEVVVESAVINEIRHGVEKVNESKKNTECGILLKPIFTDIQPGDILEAL